MALQLSHTAIERARRALYFAAGVPSMVRAFLATFVGLLVTAMLSAAGYLFWSWFEQATSLSATTVRSPPSANALATEAANQVIDQAATAKEAGKGNAPATVSPPLPSSAPEIAMVRVLPPFRPQPPKAAGAAEEAAPPPASEAAQAVALAAIAAAPSGDGEDAPAMYGVRVATYRERRNAEALLDRLQAGGFDARSYGERDGDGAMWFSVVVGRFARLEEGDRMAQRLRRDAGMEGDTILLVKQPPPAKP